MNILDKILAHKQKELEERKSLIPVERLRRSLFYKTPVVSLREYILRPESTGIIAEIKRKSPSRGNINPYIDVKELSVGYMQAGACALSILTDAEFFGGSLADLEIARSYNYCPILRKDFIIDPYQIEEARAYGADAILLIARAMTRSDCQELAVYARDLGLEVLLEVHTEQELKYSNEYVHVVGVTSRSLQDFTTDLERSMALLQVLPTECPRVAESGIHTVHDYHRLREAGYEGFLIGTQFMRHAEPAAACQKFIQDLLVEKIQV